MPKSLDFQFGIPDIVPSTQNDREESLKVKNFKKIVQDKLTQDISSLTNFPSQKEVFIFILQFFAGKNEYSCRDVDNISKTILDCLKSKLYVDDKQVRTLLVSKKVCPRVSDDFVFVGIKELQGETDIEIVKSAGFETAISLYQSTKASRSVFK